MNILNVNIGFENKYSGKNQTDFADTGYARSTLPTDMVYFTGNVSPKSIDKIGVRYKNKIQIVFTDIDGTISPKNDIVSQKTIEAFENLHQKGIPVILTTARCYKDTVPVLNKMKHCADYVITLQGGEIVDKEGVLVTKNSIPYKTAHSLENWYRSLKSEDDNVHLIMYIDNQPYSTSNIKFPWKAATSIEQVDTFDEMISQRKRIQKAVLYKTDEQKGSDVPDRIKKSFKTSGIDDLNFNVTGTGVYEFQNKGVTKDVAIDFLLKKLNINPEKVMVIGDSSNDIEMFDYISARGGLAVAMGNATAESKKHSTAITSEIEKEGFAKAVSVLFD